MIVEVRSLTKSYRLPAPGSGSMLRALLWPQFVTKQVLNGLDFAIEPGSIVGYIGPNGSGKSTTVKILTGILSPSSGSVMVCGFQPVPQRQLLARRIGTVFGNRTQLLWDISVVETLRLYADLYEIEPGQARRRVNELVEMLELGEFQHQTPRTLSLGQRVRADLAVALVHSPELLFLDEPTIGLDTLLKIKLRTILRTINSVSGTTIFLTTHDMNDIEALCTRVLVLSRGSIVFDGPVIGLRRLVANETEIRLKLSSLSAYRNLGRFPHETVSAEALSPTEIRLRFKDCVVPTHQVLQMAAQVPDLESLSVLNPTIEEVIAQIYKEQGEKS